MRRLPRKRHSLPLLLYSADHMDAILHADSELFERGKPVISEQNVVLVLIFFLSQQNFGRIRGSGYIARALLCFPTIKVELLLISIATVIQTEDFEMSLYWF